MPDPANPTRRDVLAAGALLTSGLLAPAATTGAQLPAVTTPPADPGPLRESPAYPDLKITLPTDALPAPDGPRKRIAAITTLYAHNTHADHIITKFINGYGILSRSHRPHCQVVSLHMAQTPATDIGRAIAARHNIPVFDKAADALTLGTNDLAVDGVLLVAEHGDYPYNEKGQQLYPRRELFEQVVNVFRATGKSVPVFNDKGLSYSWDNAKWMYDQHRELGFSMMAGSSVSVTWRRPPLSFGNGIELDAALAVGGFERDAYGFHCLEVLQAFVEHRKGGETGIKRVQCLSGAAVWDASTAGEWRVDLLRTALLASMPAPDMKNKPGPGETVDQFRALEPDPILFLLDHADGFRGCVYMSPLGSLTNQFAFAAAVNGRPDPVATWCMLPRPQDDHFSFLCNHVETMFRTGKASYPVERTLLTTGALIAAHDSLFEKSRWIETPWLAGVAYKVVEEAAWMP